MPPEVDPETQAWLAAEASRQAAKRAVAFQQLADRAAGVTPPGASEAPLSNWLEMYGEPQAPQAG